MRKDFRIGKAALIAYLHGEIDQYAANELKGKIDVEIESSPKKNLILELSDVELMDSSGIGLIVGRYKRVTAIGGRLILCNASENVRRMISLSGIEKIVSHYDNISEAETALITQNSERKK